MNEFDRFEKALQAAEAAGDVAAARALASDMRKMMQQGNPAIVSKEDPQVAAAKMAAKGMGAGEALAVAGGRTFDKMAMGLKQATLEGASRLPFQSLSDLANQELTDLSQQEKDKDIAYRGAQRERPFATAAGGALPYLAVPASAGVIPGALMVGGAEALQYGSPSERASRGLLGAGSSAVGGLLGKAAGGLIAPTSPAVNQTKSAALQSGEALGIKPRLSEVTGSPFLARMEDMAARTPGGAGIMDDFARGNAQAFNRAAARTMGEAADELTPTVFSNASTRLGKVFEDIKSLPGTPIRISSDVGSAADDVLRQARKMLPNQQDPNLIKLAEQAKTWSTHRGKIDGEAYQLMRSGLSEASFDATGTNRVLYGKLLETLDDSAQQSLAAIGKQELSDALKVARPQYGSLKTLEKGAVVEGGNVMPGRLAQTLRAKNPAAFKEGRGGELYDIGRYGEAFKPLTAGSQTYERMASSDLLSLIAKAPLAYGTARLTTSPLITAYPGLLATNPGALLAAQQAAQLANPAIRGATMGLLGSYAQ